MPITAFKCPACFSTVPLDHFATTNCGLAIHPDYAAAVIGEQQNNFPGGSVRVSSSSGCPRASAITTVEDMTVDPLAFNSMLTGTAWHALMERYATDKTLTEVTVTGVIDGIPMTGHIDRLLRHNDQLVIADWKHANDFSRKYLKETAKPEHIVQTSLYAELYAQQHGERPRRGVNWYHFTSSPPFIPMWYDLWTLDRCLEHKPYECEFTVAQLLHQAADFVAGKVKWQDLPLAGKSFNFGGKDACHYCAAFETCQTQATGAPF